MQLPFTPRFACPRPHLHICQCMPPLPSAAGPEDTDDLLRQFVQDALINKSTGGSTKLYDQ